MAKIVGIEEFTLPDWVLPVIYNGDYSSTTEDEDKAIESLETEAMEMCRKIGGTHYHWGDYQENGFCHRHDMSHFCILAGDCHTVELVIMGE